MAAPRPPRKPGQKPARGTGSKPARGAAPRPARGTGSKPARGTGSKPVRRSGDKPRRDGEKRTRAEPGIEAPREWGGVARQATGRLRDDRPSKASAAWRAVAGADAPAKPEPQAEWVRVDEVREEAGAAVRRGRAPEDRSKRVRKPAPAVAEELTKTAGEQQAPKLGQKLAEATRAFERERFPEARMILRPIAQRAPRSAAVRELYGLTLYRLGQWAAATKELEAFAELTGSTEQHPVLADCARALKQWGRVAELWDELKAASPGPELVTEGRIVMAGALADQGNLSEAIALLEGAVGRPPKKVREHHLRLLYALADLRERAGEVPTARSLFRRVQSIDPDFADVRQRLRALG